MQDIFGETRKSRWSTAKVDDPKNIAPVIADLKSKLEVCNIYSMEEFLSLFSVDRVPYVEPFTRVVVVIAAIVGFLVVFLSMFTAVLERTREIGIMRLMGASPGYILSILFRETIVLAIAGTVLGIGMARTIVADKCCSKYSRALRAHRRCRSRVQQGRSRR